MKVIVKSMWIDSPSVSLDDYQPEDPESFGLWIEFRAGQEGAPGADDFRLFVCTPAWLAIECRRKRAVWGRHTLVVAEFDLQVIKEAISDCVNRHIADSWGGAAQAISKYVAWEFEDYVS